MRRCVKCVVGLACAPVAPQLVPGESGAQTAVRAVRVGTREAGPADAARLGWWNVFRRELRELGWVEGQQVIYEARYADNRVERLPGLAADLVKLKVAIIVTGSAA